MTPIRIAFEGFLREYFPSLPLDKQLRGSYHSELTEAMWTSWLHAVSWCTDDHRTPPTLK